MNANQEVKQILDSHVIYGVGTNEKGEKGRFNVALTCLSNKLNGQFEKKKDVKTPSSDY